MEAEQRMHRVFVTAVAFLFVSHLSGTMSPMNGQEVFHSFRTPHFEIKHQAGISDQDARKVSDYLEKDYGYLQTITGIDLQTRPEVRIYDADQKFAKGSGERNASRGALHKRGVLHVRPVAKLEAENRFAQVLSYELSTIVLGDAAQNGCPQWLVQSFAVYHSGVMPDLAPPAGRTVHYFSDLDQDIQEYPDPPRRQEVEYLLGTTMKFFVEEFGEEKAFRVFKKFDGVTPIEDVFNSSFGQEFSSVEKAWASFVVTAVGTLPSGEKRAR